MPVSGFSARGATNNGLPLKQVNDLFKIRFPYHLLLFIWPIFMLTIRKSSMRGSADHGWLQSLHSFSFASYYDPKWMGWGNLRVINEDKIAPKAGFPLHGHRDMEIISYVLTGELAHQDSMGNIQTIRPGEFQCMSAGTGVQHSEFNHTADQMTHLLQIWIEPNSRNIAPSYCQKFYTEQEKRGQLCLVASPDGRQNSIKMHADAHLYAGLFNGEEAATLSLDQIPKCYVHVIRGELSVNQHILKTGDALCLESEPLLSLQHGKDAEVLVFTLAA